MSGNRSLEEFAGQPGDDPPDGDGESTAADPVAAEAASPDPVASTYQWQPAGGACEACGTAAAERWRDGDAMVCADCKEW